MTSNLGAARTEPFGLSRSTSPHYEDEAGRFFRPEFFNRIDAVVTFDPLSEETIRQITRLELDRIVARAGLQQNQITLRWSEEVIDLLCRTGYDHRYGARPLQRAIETLVVTPLARFLVSNPLLRACTLVVHASSDGKVDFAIAV
jgi:ATP-dependent Clp protease ATP-binding subunit ClpA